MENLQHAAIYIQGDTDKSLLITHLIKGDLLRNELSLSGIEGEIFSNIALKHFIDEELRHDHFEINTGLNNSLANSSSGEQKRALLKYILAKDPGFIILDNVFESLDISTREAILTQLKDISSRSIIIQILERKRDLLPFIENVYIYEHGTITKKESGTEFRQQPTSRPSTLFSLSVPPPLQNFPPVQNPLISMRDVSVQFGDRQILKDISWQINTGEFWQLKGPNGSGKSTILAMITGDSPKAYGQDIQLFGNKKGSGESVWSIKEKIGYFTPNMIRDFERQDSIEKMIISGFFDSVGLYIKPSDRQLFLADEWLKLIAMYDIRRQPFRLTPAAQQRIVMVVRAMVKHPPLLILDEPASGLDDESALLFTALVNKIAAETNTAVIYVSHMDEPGLLPQYIFELFPQPEGSTGRVVK
ncbi:MAG: ATP-binding cassette domain-containing protein [Ferruginibacter sp.]